MPQKCTTAFLLLLLPFAACEQQTATVLTDSRDGKKYKIVKIGTQTWMAENLNYEAEGRCYDNDPANCQKYGRLYDWETALNTCPKGWHLPSDAEWSTLVDFAGGDKVAGKKLKARVGWEAYEGKSGNGTDIYGFSALPGGVGYSGGDFGYVGKYGGWWSATEISASHAYGSGMVCDDPSVYRMGYDRTYLYSVRCLQD